MFVSYIRLSVFGIRLDPQLRLLRFEAVEINLFMGLSDCQVRKWQREWEIKRAHIGLRLSRIMMPVSPFLPPFLPEGEGVGLLVELQGGTPVVTVITTVLVTVTTGGEGAKELEGEGVG